MIKTEIYNNRYVKFINGNSVAWYDTLSSTYVNYNTLKNISLVRTDMEIVCANICEVNEDVCVNGLIANNSSYLVSNAGFCLVGNG